VLLPCGSANASMYCSLSTATSSVVMPLRQP
jgi:hypothetical protein